MLDAAKDYRTKATPGITGWFRLSVQSDGGVRHLDVGSTYPGGGEAPKGLAVRQLKSYASWVQTVQDLTPTPLLAKERGKRKLVFSGVR